MSDKETALWQMTVRAAQTTLPAPRPPDGGPVLSLRLSSPVVIPSY